MTISIQSASVPVFTQMLHGLDAQLAKGQEYADIRNIDPTTLLRARLFPDMFELSRQVQIACEFARSVCARLAGVEPPKYADDETGFDELRGLIATTLDYINAVPAESFDGRRLIVLRPGTPKERHLVGTAYLLHYGLPQFFFHVTTAYALLRHNGVAVGKRDYMGTY